LARVAWAGFVQAAETIAKGGFFSGLATSVPAVDLNGFFRKDSQERRG
jgi:hypothetical protein